MAFNATVFAYRQTVTHSGEISLEDLMGAVAPNMKLPLCIKKFKLQIHCNSNTVDYANIC